MSETTHPSSQDSHPGKSEIKSKKSKKRKTHKKDENSKTSKNELNVEGSSISHPGNVEKESIQGEIVPKAVEFLPYIPLTCPVCGRTDCLLNQASHCPLLRPEEETKVGSECNFCLTNCSCNVGREQFYPVSGIVPRDENGVAVTLLAVNGGPISDSFAYANRPKWEVPEGIPWQHRIDEWISVYRVGQDDTKVPEERNLGKKKTKAKLTRRMSKRTSEASLEEAPMSEITDGNLQQNKDPAVLTEGDGFKIVMRDDEKVLLNFNAKNCRYLNCGCNKSERKKESCGCDSMQLEEFDNYQEKCRKEKKQNKPDKIVVVKKYKKDTDSHQDDNHSSAQAEDENDLKEHTLTDRLRRKLTATDVLHKSREEFLETSLKTMLGDEYKGNDEQNKRNSADDETPTNADIHNQGQQRISFIGASCQCAYNQEPLNNLLCYHD